MEEEIKDKNENINANELNDDRVKEFDKNIYKEPKNDQNLNKNENIEENNKISMKENEEIKDDLKEELKEEIKDELKYELKENNTNIDETNSKINELTKEIEKINKEKESLFEQNKLLEEQNKKLNEENTKLTSKLKTLKESILKLKSCLEKDIYSKLESKTKSLKEALEQKNLLEKTIESLNAEIKRLKIMEDEYKIYREKFDSLIKEKSNVDNITIKQEEKLKTFEEEIDLLNQEMKIKDEKYKKLDEIYLSVIKVIEEHKKTIHNLKNKIKVKEAEENNKKIIIFQKEQEIALLRNFINSYKSDMKVRFKNRVLNTNNDNYYFPKKDFPKLKTNRSDLELISNKRLEEKFSKMNNNITNKNKNLPKINLNVVNKQNENNIKDNNNYLKERFIKEIDDKEDENIRDISNMMKNMIND